MPLAKKTVATPSPFHQRMSIEWRLVDALLGGTRAMRDAKEKWLPKHEEESSKGYEARLAKGFLFEAFADAVERVVAKPFSKDVVIKGDLPELLEPLRDNADQCGRNFTQFAKDVFNDAASYGISFILVDFPSNAGNLNLGMQRRLNIRPYFTHIRHDRLIGAKFETTQDGQNRLMQVRIIETRIEEDGPYNEVEVQYIRVINAPANDPAGAPIAGTGTWELWKKTGEGDSETDWTKTSEGMHSFPGIPIEPVILCRVDQFEASVPFRKLAWLNLAHWQSSTDQRNILSVARVGLLFAAGLTAKEIAAGIVIGPNNFIATTNPDAKMAYVEHTGAAIGAGRQDLEDLKQEMASLSLQPLVQQSGNQTATGKAIDDSKGESVAQSWVRRMESSLYNCLLFAAMWTGDEISDDVSVDVYNDFGLSQRAIADLGALDKAVTGGRLTNKTYLSELQRRGTLREDLDIEQEIEDLANEPPLVPMVGDSIDNPFGKDEKDDPDVEPGARRTTTSN